MINELNKILISMMRALMNLEIARHPALKSATLYPTMMPVDKREMIILIR
jgi:hypothetical protein